MKTINKIWYPIRNWYLDNWSKDSYFDKGKVIFVSIVAFFVLVKIIYSIFA